MAKSEISFARWWRPMFVSSLATGFLFILQMLLAAPRWDFAEIFFSCFFGWNLINPVFTVFWWGRATHVTAARPPQKTVKTIASRLSALNAPRKMKFELRRFRLAKLTEVSFFTVTIKGCDKSHYGADEREIKNLFSSCAQCLQILLTYYGVWDD